MMMIAFALGLFLGFCAFPVVMAGLHWWTE